MRDRSSSPNDSLVSESLVNTNLTFRVSVCLRRYFKDIRSRCYILVSRNRPVSWLERRIQKIFDLSGTFCLSTNGHMLPSCEPLALLNADDTVEVVPLTDLDGDIINGNTINLDIYKFNEERSSSVLQSNRKRSKRIDPLNTNVNYSGVLDTATSKRDQDTSQIIIEDCIDGTEPMNKEVIPAKSTKEIDSQEISDASASYNINVDDDTTQSLSNMKRKALAVLDSKINIERDDNKVEDLPAPPRRTRHRVRRRRRRNAESEQDVGDQDPQTEPDLVDPKVHTEDGTSTVSKLQETCQTVQTQAIMQCLVAPPAVGQVFETESIIKTSTPIPEVTRNNTICPRKARVIYSLDE